MGGILSTILGRLRLVCVVLYKDGAWEFGVSKQRCLLASITVLWLCFI